MDITLNLAMLDVASKKVTDLPVFDGANNLNPQFSGNDQQVYFLSNRDGYRNLYRYSIAGGKVEQLTDYFTGISGITEFSPALSVSKTDDVIYSYYRAQKYKIYNAKASDFKPVTVSPTAINMEAALLPPFKSLGVDLINANLDNFERFEEIPTNAITEVPYRSKFKLDYIQSSGVGASAGRFGAGLSSGIQGIFSDILGRNQIYATAAVNGEIYDFGGQVAYLNQQSRINWGGAIAHIPNISAFSSPDIIQGGNGQALYRDSYDIIRTFQDQAQLFASYPFSRVHRFEAGGSFAAYSYRVDRIADYYDQQGIYQGSERAKVPLSEANDYYQQYYGYNFQNFKVFGTDAAFVGDNTYFGITAPLSGFRYRVGVSNYIGDFNYGSLIADGRKYVRLKPITIAGRLYSLSRFGKDQSRLYGEFIGYPYLIRGYEYNSFTNTNGASSFDVNQLIGSKIAVANFEVRLPFTGPERLAAIKSKFLFSDLNAFFDVGLAYNQDSNVLLDRQAAPNSNERSPVMSAGLSLRVNVFGYFVLEPYVAVPFQRNDKKSVFGLNFAPGW